MYDSAGRAPGNRKNRTSIINHSISQVCGLQKGLDFSVGLVF